ncbi:MAG: VTT domain-containing protein [Rhodopila sp.]
MRFTDVLGRPERSELSQMEAAELLGISERTFHRCRDRHRDAGPSGLDNRLLAPSHRTDRKRPVATAITSQGLTGQPKRQARQSDPQQRRGLPGMSLLTLHTLEAWVREYGYAAIFLCIMLESIGLPLPGESLMIAAALYAANTHHLNIFALVALSAAGAICGDQIGYFIGRSVGYRLLARWGRKVGLTDERLQLGRFLFHKYGGGVVFFGRFVAFLRTFAALLAGANRMPWHVFLLWNSLGGIGWTTLYGFGAYTLGDAAKRVSGPLGIGLAVIGGIALLAAVTFIKRNESRLMEDARRQKITGTP